MTEDQDQRPRCELCLYKEDGAINKDNVAQRTYFCKRSPPIVIVMPTPGGVAMHSVNPMVNLDTWCGEYDPIEDPDDPDDPDNKTLDTEIDYGPNEV